jgi:[ribosomal protein S5]-alanine N-acetyltransferase
MEIILQTPRLVLRRFTEADAPLIYALNSSQGTLQYIHEPALNDEADALRVIREIIMPQYSLYNLGRWAIQLKEDGAFIGWCGLKYLADEDEIDLGYRLFSEYRGLGYATEAASHTIQYGFEVLKLKTIIGRAHVDNIASWTVLQKIGMLYKGDEQVDGITAKIYTLSSPVS